jgi:hypothetical protein
LDAEEIHHLADQAKELKNDPAFQAAILALRQQWHAEQMATHDKDEIITLAFRMQTLEAIPLRLQVLMNDWEAVKRRQK